MPNIDYMDGNDSFKKVTRSEFYGAVGPLNVHQHPEGSRWHNELGYVT